MQQQNFYDLAQDVAILGGVFIGIFAVFSPSWVWLRKQLFGWGSGVLCAFGTILIVASIFKTVSLAMGPSGIDFKLGQQIAELQKEVAEAKTATLQTNQKFNEVASALQSGSTDRAAQVAQVQQKLDQLSATVTQLTQTSASTNQTLQKVFTQSPPGGEINRTPYMMPNTFPEDNGSKYQKD